jgi:hypothetical protein
LATGMMFSAMCATVQADTASGPAASPIETQLGKEKGEAALTYVTTNRFAGEYCGTVGSAHLRINITKRGRVTGSLRWVREPNRGSRYGRQSYYGSFSGRVSANGRMRLNLTTMVSYRGGRGQSRRSRATVVLGPVGEDGSLAGSWRYGRGGTSPFSGTHDFSWSPCQ